MTDIDRVDDVLSEHEEDIEMQYGKPYDELTAKEQTQAILSVFFEGARPEWKTKKRATYSTYGKSARALRDGINYARETGEYGDITVESITRKGKTFDIIRDGKTGRIKSWVK